VRDTVNNFVAVLVGAAWMVTALLKLLEPDAFLRYVTTHLGQPPELAWAIVGAELLLGSSTMALALLRRASRVLLGLLVASLGVGAALMAFSWFSGPGETSCGCFGTEVELTRLQRVAVAGGLVFASSLAMRHQLGYLQRAPQA
jgi:hypothetical protein